MRRAFLALVALAGCDPLRTLPIGEPELPWLYGSSTDWGDGEHGGHRLAMGDPAATFFLASDLPVWTADCGDGTPCADEDRDGIGDAWEEAALDRLRPVVRLHPDEPLVVDPTAVVGSIARVAPAPGWSDRIRIFLVLGYSYDYGRCAGGAHRGDSERVVLDLRVEPLVYEVCGPAGCIADGWTAHVDHVYLAAHEWDTSDLSRIVTPDQLQYVWPYDSPSEQLPYWVVYAARAKHGSFPSVEVCDQAADGMCEQEDCSGEDGLDIPILMPVLDAGEPGHPKSSAIRDQMMFAGEEIWIEREFCGGLGDEDGPCSSSIRSKLTADPFDPFPPI